MEKVLNNSITVHPDSSCSIRISKEAWNELEKFTPKGCPFDGYTLADLLKDLIMMYSWKIYSTMSIVDYIRLIKETDIHGTVYGDNIIAIIKSFD